MLFMVEVTKAEGCEVQPRVFAITCHIFPLLLGECPQAKVWVLHYWLFSIHGV